MATISYKHEKLPFSNLASLVTRNLMP